MHISSTEMLLHWYGLCGSSCPVKHDVRYRIVLQNSPSHFLHHGSDLAVPRRRRRQQQRHELELPLVSTVAAGDVGDDDDDDHDHDYDDVPFVDDVVVVVAVEDIAGNALLVDLPPRRLRHPKGHCHCRCHCDSDSVEDSFHLSQGLVERSKKGMET